MVMAYLKTLSARILAITALIFCTLSVAAAQQTPQPKPTPEQDDVLRVNTELVQTDVVVTDKNGRFVEGLQREQFELTVDGKRQPISFFEGVVTGTNAERASLRKVRGGPGPAAPPSSTGETRRRTVLFFVDDMHLEASNLMRTRKSITYFIDKLMEENDQVAIISATGNIGFLQQLTGNRAVLRAALERIVAVPSRGRDGQRPPMSEYAAYLIKERNDRQLYEYFVEQTIKAERVERSIAEALVTQRSRFIMDQSDAGVRLAFFTLIELMRSAAKLPGRKLAFFISDGFVSNFTGSDVTTQLRTAINIAASAGVVFYSIDSRGLSVDSYLDASSSGGFDPTGVLLSRAGGERSFTQEAMNALASDTGGRTIFNTNSMTDGMEKALDETSRYYLLAWRPDTAEQRKQDAPKIKIEIVGHPDWKVRLRKGFLGQRVAQNQTKAETRKKAKSDDALTVPASGDLVSGTESIVTYEEMPTALYIGYKHTSGGNVQLTAAVQVSGPANGKSDTLDVLGAVFDTKGKAVGSFKQKTDLPSAESSTQPAFAYVNYQVNVPPGLYQVAIVARDSSKQRFGRALDWIEIPKVKPGMLSLSTLYLGELSGAGTRGQVGINASLRFARTSRLRFTTYITGATRGAASPDVGVKIQILRGDQVVITSELKVPTEKVDSNNIPYSGEFALGSLAPGRYVLQLTAVDRASNATASQQVKFTVY